MRIKGKRILIIEDDKQVVELLKEALEQQGYGVVTLENGEKGIEFLEKEAVDLIVLDVVIPEGMDGFHFFKAIKSQKSLKDIPVLVISGRTAMKETFESLGANYFLAKPFSMEDFKDKIASLLSKAVLMFSDTSTASDSILRNLQLAQYEVKHLELIDDFYSELDKKRYLLIILEYETCQDELDSIVDKILASTMNKRTPLILYTRKKSIDVDSIEYMELSSSRDKLKRLYAWDMIDREYTKKIFMQKAKKYLTLELSAD
jgi:CheY-like chemotaxis protein